MFGLNSMGIEHCNSTQALMTLKIMLKLQTILIRVRNMLPGLLPENNIIHSLLVSSRPPSFPRISRRGERHCSRRKVGKTVENIPETSRRHGNSTEKVEGLLHLGAFNFV